MAVRIYKRKEGEIEHWVKQLFRAGGWWVRKFVSPARRSAPDDIFAKGGRVFFIEFKATGVIPSPLQQHEHKVMRDAGLDVYVCDSREQGKAIYEDEEFGLELG